VMILVCSVFGGCSSTAKHSNNKGGRQDQTDNKKSEQVRRFFSLGKEEYMNCKFSESIKYLKKAIDCEPKRSKKAECFLYLGASYFYKEDIRSARYCFSQAKMYNSNIEPSRSEFPGEIIELFRNSN